MSNEMRFFGDGPWEGSDVGGLVTVASKGLVDGGGVTVSSLGVEGINVTPEGGCVEGCLFPA